ncbi:hypothetical protein Taro_050924, partial [Colocasia esculenta]|nr:hypothetical protein [Colocasia esculenta]
VEIDAMRVMKRPIQARLFPTMESGAGRECGGTGFFLPLYRFQSDSRRSQGRKCDGDGQKQKLYAVVAKKGMPLQPHTEVGLPPEWTY